VFIVALVGCVGLYLVAPAIGISRGAVAWPAVGVLVSIALCADYLYARTAKRAANKVRDLARDGQFDEAIPAANIWLDRYGADKGLRSEAAWSLSIKAWALTELNRSQEAVDVCDEILNGFEDDDLPVVRVRLAQALERKAFCLGKLGRVEEQLEALDELLARFSESVEPSIRDQVAEALVNKEIVLGKAGRYEEAITIADEVFRRFVHAKLPGLRVRAAAALDHKGGWLAELGRTAEAIVTWDDLDARYRESSDPALRVVVANALMDKAGAMEGSERRSLRRDICGQLIARYGNDGQPEIDGLVANALVNTAIDIAVNDGLEDEAEASFIRAIDLDPTGHNLGAYAWFLEIFRRDADGAESYYRKAIESNSDGEPKADAQTLDFYASFLDRVRHDPDAAESYYLQAIGLAPQGVERAAHLSSYADFLEFARHDYAKAEEFCKRAIEADPADGNYLESYARFLRLRRSDLDGAESFYKRAIEADSQGQEHLAGYAHFLAACRHDPAAAETQFRAAEQHCRELINADESPRTKSVLLAQAVLAQGRTQDGLKLLSQADRPGLRPDLQILFYFLRYAHETRSSRRVAGLSSVKELLNSDVRSRGADLDGNTVQARRANHPEPDFLEKLAGVITNGDDIKELDAFAAWHSA
jgi:tetratricopeptide (TPR) repeat protein